MFRVLAWSGEILLSGARRKVEYAPFVSRLSITKMGGALISQILLLLKHTQIFNLEKYRVQTGMVSCCSVGTTYHTERSISTSVGITPLRESDSPGELHRDGRVRGRHRGTRSRF